MKEEDRDAGENMGYIKPIAILVIGFVLGYIVAAIGTYSINEDVYWEQYKHGIVDGWNKGFESGTQFGQGKIIHYYQIKGYDLPYGIINESGNFTEKTTWYYRKGYDSITAKPLDLNPFNDAQASAQNVEVAP